MANQTAIDGPPFDLTLAMAIRSQIKRLRKEPSLSAKRLLSRVAYFRGNEFRAPSSSVAKVTKEGAKVVQETIQVLNKCPPLMFDDDKTYVSLDLAAEDHAAYIGSAGIVSHMGEGETSPHERIERYAKWIQATGEVIWYGTIDHDKNTQATAQEIIDDLIIDDGVPSRGHRIGNSDAINPTIT